MPRLPRPVLAPLAIALLPFLPLPAGGGVPAHSPLASPPPATGSTLFVEGARLAMENRYADPKMWGELYQEFSVGAVGTGVTVGDYNHDGRPDLYVVSKTEAGRLFRNDGNWKFTEVSQSAGLTDSPEIWKQGATFADVDNDGWLDLYVCRFNAPNLFYRNLGNGTFREEAAARGLAVVDASGMAAFCDYDRDGDLDVLVQTNLLDVRRYANGQPNHLLRNDGTGHFQEVTEAAGLRGVAQGHSATWWDYDDDGWPDLYLANDFEAPDFLYRNLGNGTFANVSATALPVTPYSAMGADLGDVDNDGHLDLLVADMAPRSREKDQRNMALSRARAKEENVAEAAPTVLRNTLFLGTGGPRVQEAAWLTGLATTDWTWALRFEDFDNDGKVDLFVTNGMVRELHHGDLMAKIMTSESGLERVKIMRDSPVFAEANLAYRNEGDLRFSEVGQAWGLDEKGVSFGAATGDFDGDGDLDFVYTQYEAAPRLLRNQSQQGNRVVFALEGQPSNRFGVGAKVTVRAGGVRQTRTLTLARGYLSSSEPILHFGLGDATRLDTVDVAWPSGRLERYEGLAVNQRYTLREGEGAPVLPAPPISPWLVEKASDLGLNLTAREEAFDETRTQPLLTRRLHRRGPALAAGDLNGDGRDDLVVGGTTRDPARIYFSNTTGAFTAGPTLPAGTVPLSDGPLALIDVDGNGTLDLLQTRGGANLPGGSPAYQARLWLNDGTGQWTAAPDSAIPAESINAGAAAIADFNHDGHPDVFLGARALPGRYPLAAPSSLWLGTGQGWRGASEWLAGPSRALGLVTAAAAVDINQDGWTDLVVATEWGPVRCLLNAEGQGFREEGSRLGFDSAGQGWWSGLAVADLNEDGRPDFALGNLGLNTPYRASAKEPQVLLYGDFKNPAKPGPVPAVIETINEGGTLYPLRSKKQLATAVPSVANRYPLLSDYAKSDLGAILGAESLARASRLQATQFASGTLLSQPDGTYRFAAWPRRAQLAPTYGIAFSDLNHDGHLDLLLAQNSTAPLPVIGRFTGSLGAVLVGDGRGGWDSAPPALTGWWVPGDAKALVELDTHGEALWCVSSNQEPLLCFSPKSPLETYRLRLRGASGTAAVNATVEIVSVGGLRRTLFAYSGNGYYSQGTATLTVALPTGDSPREVRVTGPSGKRTSHSWPAKQLRVDLTLP